MNKISMDILSSAKAAESTLRREERQALGSGLPAGHPLKEKLDQAGDLDGLPDDHPLIVEMKAAEARYEQAQEQAQEREAEGEQEKARKVRRAQKLDRAKARRAQIEKEETENDEVREAAKAVNARVDSALTAVRGLYEALEENEGVLTKHRMNAARTARLKRLLYAFERGVSETRMSRV